MTEPVSDPNSPVPSPVRPMPRLARGGRWSFGLDGGPIPAAQPYELAARRSEFKEQPVSLNEPADDERNVDDPEPDVLPDPPELGAVQEDVQEDSPTDAELQKLGEQLDAADFAEALRDVPEIPPLLVSGGLVESSVDADHPPVGLGCPNGMLEIRKPLTEQELADIKVRWDSAKSDVRIQVVPAPIERVVRRYISAPPSRPLLRRILDRIRRRPR